MAQHILKFECNYLMNNLKKEINFVTDKKEVEFRKDDLIIFKGIDLNNKKMTGLEKVFRIKKCNEQKYFNSFQIDIVINAVELFTYIAN